MTELSTYMQPCKSKSQVVLILGQATANTIVLVTMKNFLVKSGKARTMSLDQTNVAFFLIRSNSGLAMSENSGI